MSTNKNGLFSFGVLTWMMHRCGECCWNELVFDRCRGRFESCPNKDNDAGVGLSSFALGLSSEWTTLALSGDAQGICILEKLTLYKIRLFPEIAFEQTHPS